MGKAASLANIGSIADSSLGFRNRIINGAMVIDQRNAGASQTPTADDTFNVDRWAAGINVSSKFSMQQNTADAPKTQGFTNCVKITSLSAYSVAAGDVAVFKQIIEGFNIADLAWGTASASPVTLSFWVRSSLTGTFGGTLMNGGQNRAYPFTYTINTANTFEYKTITIAGDTTGTWAVGNTAGIRLNFQLGVGSTFVGTAGSWSANNYFGATGATSVVGTNGATFYITGVQLEKGSTATSFDYRPYGTELALCQRYYYKQQAVGTSDFFGSGQCTGTTTVVGISNFPTTMRTSPTALEQTGTAANYATYTGAGVTTACSSVPSFVLASVWQGTSLFTVASGLTTGQAAAMRSNNAAAYLAWSAEL
jgi:hypothetical protein